MHSETVATLLLQYKYVIMVPAALVAGPLVGMLSGFFIRLGELNFFFSYLCLMLGELIGDVFWYWLGYHYGESFAHRFGKFVGITDAHIEIVKKLFAEHDRGILFVTKLTTGFGFAIVVLFTAGLSKVPFRKYITTNISGQFLWTGGLIFIGFFLGNFYLAVDNAFEKISIASVILIVLALMVGFGRYVGGEIAKKYQP